MHNVLEELASVIGRAWARQWLESLRKPTSAVQQIEKSDRPTQESADKVAADSKRE